MDSVGVHQRNQNAFAQATIGDADTLGRPFAADGLEDGAAGQHQIGAVAADAGMGDAAVEGHGEQDLHGLVDLAALHPQAIDLLALVALEAEMQAGQRGDGARGADEVDGMIGDHLAQLFAAAELAQVLGDIGHHGLEDLVA